AHYEAVFEAHADFQKAIPKFKAKRNDNLAKATGKHPLVLTKSIVSLFYLGRKNRFTDYTI
nr:hypothetical protein [Bacteroidales bacterium]